MPLLDEFCNALCCLMMNYSILFAQNLILFQDKHDYEGLS